MNAMNSKTLLSLVVLGIKRHKWISFFSFVTILTPFVVAGFVKKPVYMSRATVYLKQNNYSTSSIGGHIHPPRSLGIELAILKSQYLAEKVVESLPDSTLRDLEQHTEYTDYEIKVINFARKLFRKPPIMVSPQQKATMELRNARMNFHGLGRNGIIQIEGESEIPKVALDLVNAYIDVFKTQSSHFAIEQQADLDKSLSLQIMNARSLLKKSENDLLNFQQKTQVRGSKRDIDVTKFLSQQEEILNDLKTKRSSLLLTETDSHPDVVFVNQQIQETEKKIHSLKRIAHPMGSHIDMSTEEWEAYLESNLKMDRDILKELELERSSIRIIADSNLENVIVIDPPALPIAPEMMKGVRIIGLGVVMSLFGAIGIPFAVLLFRKPIQGEEELKAISSLPILASVPRVPSKGIPSRFGSRLVRVDQPIPPPEFWVFQKSFETLYFRLKQLAKTENEKVFLFTSASPEDGKSTTVINLALMMASWGHKTTIIDTDHFRGNISKHLPLNNAFQLEDFFRTKGNPPRILWDDTNLSCISLGKSGHDFWKNTDENTVKQWIESLRYQSDFILIDTPPILASTNLLGFSQMVDETILVVRNKVTLESELDRMLTFLRDHNFKTAGTILNESRNRHTKYYAYAYNPKVAHK